MTMSDENIGVVEAYVSGMQNRGELLPGSAERILELVGDEGSDSAILARVVEAIEGGIEVDGSTPKKPIAGRFKNPEYVADKPEMELRKVLNRLRLGGHIRPSAVDKLVKKWAAATAGMHPARMAGFVAEQLTRREHRDHLVHPLALPATERRVRDVLGELSRNHFIDRDADLDALAQRWADLGHRQPHEIARVIAERLRMPIYADLAPVAGGRDIDLFDPLFHAGQPTADEQRAVDQLKASGIYDDF